MNQPYKWHDFEFYDDQVFLIPLNEDMETNDIIHINKNKFAILAIDKAQQVAVVKALDHIADKTSENV